MATPSSNVRLAGTAALTLLLGLAVGGFLIPGAVSHPEAFELDVPGTLRVSVTCGTTTVHAEGARAHFLAEPGPCEVEAMLSPVMPVRGPLELTDPGTYRCVRVEVDLQCEGPL